MSIQKLGRGAVLLCFASLLSGCSLLNFWEDSETEAPVEQRSNACQLNPSSCMYEGSYEPGEDKYAIEEARRLNKAALERLRRSGL